MEKNKEQAFLILVTVQNILDNLKTTKFMDRANTQHCKINGKESGKMDIYKARANRLFSVQIKLITHFMKVHT